MVNVPPAQSQPIPGEVTTQPGTCPPDNKLPENSQENLDARLDHAIEETFPTSDPISVTITKGPEPDRANQDARNRQRLQLGRGLQLSKFWIRSGKP